LSFDTIPQNIENINLSEIMANNIEEEGPPGQAAPEILEDRIWVDGCWDFFHHGTQYREVTPVFIYLHVADALYS
jgi:hypothetical protein